MNMLSSKTHLRKCLIAVFVVLGIFELAQITGCVNTKPQPEEAPHISQDSQALENMEYVAMAWQLALYGRAHRSVSAYVAAIDLLLTHPYEVVEDDEWNLPQEASSASIPSLLDPEMLLVDARRWVPGDSLQQQLLDRLLPRIDAWKERDRGALGSIKARELLVPSGAEKLLEIAFEGGEEAIVSVIGEGASSHDLDIYDQSRHLIGSTKYRSKRSRVTWIPARRGRFTIRLTNRSATTTRYLLEVN